MSAKPIGKNENSEDFSCFQSFKATWNGKKVFSMDKFVIGLSTILLVTGISLLIFQAFSHYNMYLPGVVSSSIGGCLFFCGLITYCVNKSNGCNSEDSEAPKKKSKKLTPHNEENLGIEEYFASKGVFGLPPELIRHLKLIKQKKNTDKSKINFDAGILLHGGPGCGKTTIAKYIGEALGCYKEHIIILSPGDLKEKWSGESEKKIKNLFKIPDNEFHVIVIDEIDGILGKRDGWNQHHDQLVNEMLIALDGVEHNANFLLIGCTNKIHLLDEAAIRRGRMGKKFLIESPTEEARQKIFAFHLTDKSKFDDNISAEHLAKLTNGFTGAMIAGVIRDAENFCATEEKKVTTTDFEQLIKKEKPIN